MKSSAFLLVAATAVVLLNDRLLSLAAPVNLEVTNENATETEQSTPKQKSNQSPLPEPPSSVAAANKTSAQPSAEPAAKAAAEKSLPGALSSAAAGPTADAAATSLSKETPAPNDDVSEPSYDDVELALSRQMADEPYDVTDDEAMLEQLFTPRRTRQSDIDVSPKAMAEYLMLTGDFTGVQQAVDDFVSSGVLTPDEADRYKDAVGLEFASLAQQTYIPPREQRSDNYRLQQDSYEADSQLPAIGDYPEYDVNSVSGGVLLPVIPADDGTIQQQSYLPADPEALTQIDSRFLEELLLQQQQQQQLQPVNEFDGENVDDNDADETFLQNVEYQTSRAPVSSSGAEAPSGDSLTSLEAELESLPAEDHQTVEHDDKAEEELEQIGKLLRNSSKQGEKSADKKP